MVYVGITSISAILKQLFVSFYEDPASAYLVASLTSIALVAGETIQVFGVKDKWRKRICYIAFFIIVIFLTLNIYGLTLIQDNENNVSIDVLMASEQLLDQDNNSFGFLLTLFSQLFVEMGVAVICGNVIGYLCTTYRVRSNTSHKNPEYINLNLEYENLERDKEEPQEKLSGSIAFLKKLQSLENNRFLELKSVFYSYYNALSKGTPEIGDFI